MSFDYFYAEKQALEVENLDEMKYCALIVAAGKGLRMKTKTAKQLLMYKGKSVLESAVIPFLGNEKIEEVVIAVPSQTNLSNSPYYDISIRLEKLYGKHIRLVHGGNERSVSVYNGLVYIENLYLSRGIKSENVNVLIHDGARPEINEDIIDRNIGALRQHDAVCTAVKAVDSMRIKSLNSETDYPIIITEQIDRDRVFNVQTPQSFRLDVVKKAYEAANRIGYTGTDDASIVEYSGKKIAIVEGSYSNIKVTTETDIPVATRVGIGYDVHKLSKDRRLILCGVEIDSDIGLIGHSDADVAIHALIDAILGASSMGDIGRHFPDSDDRYKDISSIKLLEETIRIVGGVSVVNVDITIIAESPKISPYIEKMRERLSFAMGIDVNAINVKATTTEGIGFTGRKEGIAAMAICSIEGRF